MRGELSDRRCYTTTDGYHIPGCMGCAATGSHRNCTCTRTTERDRYAALERRVAALERAVERARKGETS